MSLYTVRFTTKKQITKYDDKRNPIATIDTETEVVLHHLPAITAQGYAKCDNFQMIQEYADPADSGRASYRRREHRNLAGEPSISTYTMRRGDGSAAPMKRPTAKRPNAAATGDLSAAING